MVYALCFVLFMIGLYSALTNKNIIKIVIGLAIMEYAANLFLILLGYRKGGVAPVVSRSTGVMDFLATSVDPLPQALVLTSVVVGLAVIALLVAIAVRVYEKYGTFDITQIRRLKG